MGITNQGSQTHLFDFRTPAKGRDFNKLNRDTIKPGIYKGLNISFSGNEVFISAGKILINCAFDSQDKLAMKIDFDSMFSYGTILPSQFGQNEILFIEFEYGEVVENYADFRHVSTAQYLLAPNPNAVIIGEVQFDGSNNIIGIDYSRRTWGLTNADVDYAIPDRLVYYDTDTPAKKWRVDGSLFPTGTKDLQYQTFNEATGRILTTSPTNTTSIENSLTIINNLGTGGYLTVGSYASIIGRVSAGQFDGRVPLGGVVPIVGTFSSANNGGSVITPSGIPSTGVVSDDGFQRCDGVAVGTGATLTGYVPKIDDERFIEGSSSLGTLSTDTGVNNGNNTITLTTNELPAHSHGVTDPGHSHTIDVGGLAINFNPGPGAYADIVVVTAGLNTYSQTTGISINNSGSGNSFDIRPKYISAIFVIRVR